MEISIKDLHLYFKLVSTGEAQPLNLLGSEGSDSSSLLIPWVDNDEVILYDLSSDSKIRLSDSTKKKILETIDSHTAV
jgi:hypothetical protein